MSYQSNYISIWYDMIWHDMTWHDVTWRDVMCYDMIWYIWCISPVYALHYKGIVVEVSFISNRIHQWNNTRKEHSVSTLKHCCICQCSPEKPQGSSSWQPNMRCVRWNHPFPNNTSATVEVMEWMTNFFLYCTGHMIIYSCWHWN